MQDESLIQVVREGLTPSSLPVDLSDDDEAEDNREPEILATTASVGHSVSGCRMVGYGIGHFYNDLCASMWFTYLMIFLERVLYFKSSMAGFLMLIGQVTDAISTPSVGMASDSSTLPFCLKRLGRRISWHLIGTICVTLSFPFIFNKCFLCGNGETEWRIVWYVPFIMLFQFGWAAVQISHLALIPELTEDGSRRVTLGSLRYNFTVLANLTVFAAFSALLNMDDSGGGIGPSDLGHFSLAAWSVLGLGLATSLIFYLTTKEPSNARRLSRLNSTSSAASELAKMSWKNWFSHIQFYQVSLLYMLSRLYINVLQVYFPFYITVTASFSKKYIAILPMISYISSFLISSLISAPIVNRFFSRKVLYLLGCLFGLGNSALMFYKQSTITIFSTAVLIGIAQAIILVSALAITADLINKNTESGAFVYGIMSFLDKLANGIVYQIIELLNPHCGGAEATEACTKFYRNIMSFVPGGCLVLALLILLTLSRQNIGIRSRRTRTVIAGETEDESASLVANDILGRIQEESIEADRVITHPSP